MEDWWLEKDANFTEAASNLASSATQTQYEVEDEETQTDFASPWEGVTGENGGLRLGKDGVRGSTADLKEVDPTTAEWERENLRYGWGGFTPQYVHICTNVILLLHVPMFPFCNFKKLPLYHIMT